METPTIPRKFFSILMCSQISNWLEVQRFVKFVILVLCHYCLLAGNYYTIIIFSCANQEIAADENNVKKASSYLLDVVLPKFVQELCTLEVSPMDGQTLTEALHAHGINMRYIGKVSRTALVFVQLLITGDSQITMLLI